MELAVIIAAFNRERTVGATLDSVLACGTDVEVVVVDDGSADGTAVVAAGFGPRVKVVAQANAGPATARNTGLRLTTAPIVAFLDSDDCWNPGVVPDCLKALRDHPDIDVLFCETLFGNPADGYRPLSAASGRGRFQELLASPAGPDLYLLPRDRFVPMMIERNQVFLGSALFRRDVLAAGGGFDPARFGGEDYELCLRYAATHRFAFCQRPLARYEKHSEGLSANPDRMAREFAQATRTIARHPALTPDMRRLARDRHRQLAFEYGYLAYDRGDFAEARTRFAAGLREGAFSAKSAAFWLACRLPGPAMRLLRRAKQGAH